MEDTESAVNKAEEYFLKEITLFAPDYCTIFFYLTKIVFMLPEYIFNYDLINYHYTRRLSIFHVFLIDQNCNNVSN